MQHIHDTHIYTYMHIIYTYIYIHTAYTILHTTFILTYIQQKMKRNMTISKVSLVIGQLKTPTNMNIKQKTELMNF